jgi:uncharacterized protein YifN (PemK superfamily)
MDERKMLAKWLSAGSVNWCELYRVPGSNGNPDWISYQSDNGCGCMGPVNPEMTEERAVSIMQGRIDRGWFAPDVAVNPLKRVA